jgi:hypothetical protein
MMGLSPQHIQNSKSNPDILIAAQNFQRAPGVQPVYANMDGSLKRMGTWEEGYFHQNSFEMPPPPNYKK